MKKIFSIAALSLVSVAALAQTAAFPNPKVKVESTSDFVKGYIVSDDGSHAMTPVTLDFDVPDGGTPSGTIIIRPDVTRQKIDGFGFAITGSAAYNLMKMKPEARKQLLNKTFSPRHGYGCSFVRVPIGCSDFSLSEYTCCDTEGIDNFSLTSEEYDYIIPVLKEILSVNPDLKIISAPWTAPRWMKTNRWWTDGQLRRECYQDYAEYFARWIEAFREQGVNIYAVTPQNEPLNRGNSASMYMGWDEQRDFIKEALGPKLQSRNLPVKIFAFDHNYNYDNIDSQKSYPVKIYADPDADKYVAGAAFHNYGGSATEMTAVHNARPDKELLFTEWTAGSWSWPGVGVNGTTTDAQAILFDVLSNWGQGAIVWNFMLDSDHGPHRPGGATTANGAVDINTGGYDTLTYNSFYYVICTAAYAVSKDAVRIALTGSVQDVACLAFDNGDGYGVVLMNKSSSEKKVKIQEGSRSFVAVLPPKSLASYRW